MANVHFCYTILILILSSLQVLILRRQEPPQQCPVHGAGSVSHSQRYCLICNSFLRNEGAACIQGDTKFSEKCISSEEYCFTAKGIVGNERIIERGCINRSLISGTECKNLILDSQYQKIVSSRVCSCDSDNCNSEDLLSQPPPAATSLVFKIAEFVYSTIFSW